MTEKRFEYVYITDLGVNAIVDNATGKHIPLSNRIADKLNELNDEKDELKRNYDLCVHRRMNDHNEVHRLEEENKELKKENNELKQQFILLLKKLGKKNVQCSFCEYGEHYSELVRGYYEPRFICHKKGQEYTQRSFCEDWKIMVK